MKQKYTEKAIVETFEGATSLIIFHTRKILLKEKLAKTRALKKDNLSDWYRIQWPPYQDS